MTINFGPVCTCNVPCSAHGYRQFIYPTTTTAYFSTITTVCQGRHCAHDAKCNKTYTINEA